jgi:hypothetical protein
MLQEPVPFLLGGDVFAGAQRSPFNGAERACQ